MLPLSEVIDRFIAIATERSAADPGGPFRFDDIRGAGDAQASFDVYPHRTRLYASSQTRARRYTLSSHGVLFSLFLGETAIEGGSAADANYLAARYVISGESTYYKGGAVVAEAKAGDYVFRMNKSPLTRLSASANYSSLLLFIPVPTEQRVSVYGGTNAKQNIKQYLENGFFVTSRSNLWGVHLAYALNYAMASATGRPNADKPDRAFSEFLYLLCCQELAAQVGNRSATRQYSVIPFKLKIAEQIIVANAERAPAVSEVAAEAGLSEQKLHALFAKFRGTSPREFIREQRLLGIRSALQGGKGTATVTEIVAAWGYQNFGNFSAAYKKRFGELPSDTIRHAT